MQTFQQVNESSADSAAMLRIIFKCTHCGEDTNKGNKFCNHCTYAKGRKEMCEENKKIMPNWKCKLCET